MSLNIFKEPTRYSQNHRPKLQTRLLFSPVKRIVDGVYKIDNRQMIRDHLKENSICTVIKNNKNTVLVQFPEQNDTDLVSPEFLITIELTKQGKIILGDKWKRAFEKKVS